METTTSRAATAEKLVSHYIKHINRDFRPAVVDYDAQRAIYEDPRLAEAEKLFDQAIREYKELLSQSKSLDANRVANCHSWEELAAIIYEAEDTYVNHANGFRRAVRAVGDYESGLQVWAGLLPTDNNMSIMAGGVKLMLGAAGRRSTQRERMLAALRRLLDAVADSEQGLRQFNGDQELRKIALALYVAMLKMIEACINSLLHESFGTKLMYGFIGERKTTVRKMPKDTVDHICAHCDDMLREFNKRIQTLTVTKITETASATKRVEAHMTETVEPRVVHTDNVTSETYKTAKAIRNDVATHGDILLHIRGMLQDLLSNNEWQKEAEERKSQATLRLHVENYQLGMEHVRSLTPTEAPSEVHKKFFLWKIIDVDPERCVEEAGSMLRNGQLPSRAPAQVLKMYRSPRVKDFLRSAASDAVFVEAPMEGHELARCSSMSLACAMLLQDLSGQSPAAAIHYFCGAHNNAKDLVGGGIGIARILIGQLLCLQDFDFAFLSWDWRIALEQGNPRALYGLFEQLVGQLKVTTLFCVIDSITLFEGQQRKDETVALISELLRVAVDCRHLVHMKLLVTSSSRSRSVAPLFRHEGLNGIVRLKLDDEEADVSMRAVRLEIARNGGGHSPSPAGGRGASQQSPEVVNYS